MKKYIYVLIGIFLLAGIVFATTNTDLLQGNFGDRTPGTGTQNLPGGGGLAITGGAAGNTNNTTTSGAIDGVDGTDTGFKADDELIIGGAVTTVGTGGFKPSEPEEEKERDKVVLEEASSGTVKDSANLESREDKEAREASASTGIHPDASTSVETTKTAESAPVNPFGSSSTKESTTKQESSATVTKEYYVWLEVLNEEGEFIDDLKEFNFSGSKDHEQFKALTSYYQFTYSKAEQVYYNIEKDGYQDGKSSKIPARTNPSKAETVTLVYEEPDAFCEELYIGADNGSTLNADEAERASEIDVTFQASSNDWDATIKVTNDNNTKFSYSDSGFAHNATTGEIQFFINDRNEADIEFDATLTPGATFTATVLGEESTCTASFTVDQSEPVAADPEPEPTPDPDPTPVDFVPEAEPEPNDTDLDGFQDDSIPQEPKVPAEQYINATQDVEQPNYDTGEIFSCDHSFSDILNTVNEATICWLADEGVINGKSNNYFGYNENITVAEYLKVLLILSGESPSQGRSSFTNGTHWGEGWLVRAEELDVLRKRDGFPANVNHPITRADAALYAMRLIGETYYPTSSPYSDVQTNDYFGYAVIYLSDLNTNIPEEGNRKVLEGYEDGNYKPYSYIKRGEAMSLLTGMFFALFQ